MMMFGKRVLLVATATAVASIALLTPLAAASASAAVESSSTSSASDACIDNKDKTFEFENLQQNLDSCILSQTENAHKIQSLQQNLSTTQNLQTDLQLLQTQQTTTIQQLKSTTAKLQTCKEDSIALQSNLNDVLQSQTNLENSIEITKRAHNDKLKSIRMELTKAQKEVQNHKNIHKALNLKWLDSRTDIQDLQADLRKMRVESQNTYVNTTLIVQDVQNLFVKYTDAGIDYVVEHVWNHDVWNHEVVDQGKFIYRSHVHPLLVVKSKSLYEGHVATHVNEGVKRLRQVDAIEGGRLACVSSVKYGSKAVLDYMFLTTSKDKNKDKKHGSDRDRKSLGCKCGKLKKMLVTSLKYAESNSERVVNNACAIVAVLMVWRVFVTFLHLIFWVCFGRNSKRNSKSTSKNNKNKSKGKGKGTGSSGSSGDVKTKRE